MEDIKEESNSDINKNLNNDSNSNNNSENPQNMSTENTFLEEYGFIAKINEEIFNPEEVSILAGDSMTREITQLVQFLCESYPFEAIDYCLKRCFYKSFSKTSLLDKCIKYLLDKYKNNENSEILITNLFYAYKDNLLISNIKNVNQFNSSEDMENKQMTKIVYCDLSKENVQLRNTQNEIMIEIDKNYINENNILPLKESENEEIETFLCEKHHLYKRFCRRNNFIYVYDFFNYEKIDNNINRINKKKKNSGNNKEESKKLEAIFHCEQEGCHAKYRYNFYNNRFTEIIPHNNDEVAHDEKENAPSYYQENINLLIEKPYITDIQLVITDN